MTSRYIHHMYYDEEDPKKECWICFLQPKETDPVKLYAKKWWAELPLCSDHSIDRLLVKKPNLVCYICWIQAEDDDYNLISEYSFEDIGTEKLPLCGVHDLGKRGRDLLKNND